MLPFSVFASHTKITPYALKQLFRASSCKQTLVGRFHHLIGSYEMINHFSQHTYAQLRELKQFIINLVFISFAYLIYF